MSIKSRPDSVPASDTHGLAERKSMETRTARLETVLSCATAQHGM